MSYYPGSAGGLDGLKPQILKDLTSKQNGINGERLAKALMKFASLVLSGSVPEEIRPVFFGATLTALKKPSGGTRPIAVGNVWRRLISKSVVNRITPALSTYLQPHQLGVGVKNGAEVGAHTSRIFWNSHHSQFEPRAFLKLDFKNAFNELRRDCMLEEVKQHFPQIYPFAAQAYQNPSNLYFGNKYIPSKCGIQQGDPMCPALFSLTIQPLVSQMTSDLNLWYLDDCTLAGEPKAVLEDLQTISSISNFIALQLNPSKSEIAVLGGDPSEKVKIINDFKNVTPDIKIIDETDASVLGSPLTEVSTRCMLERKTSEFTQLSSRLSELSSHSDFYLSRISISTPRLIYFLRCAPAWRQRHLLNSYDAALRSTLEVILNCSLPDKALTQSSLPVKIRGLGVRYAIDSAIPCFLASYHGCLPLINLLLPNLHEYIDPAPQEALEFWTSSNRSLLNPPESKQIQSLWEKPIQESKYENLINTVPSSEDRARLLVSSHPHSGSWLNALPSLPLGTHLSNETFRISVALRLGSDVCVPHNCPCGTEVNSKGLHGLCCIRSAGRYSKHAAANDIIKRALTTAEIPSILEPSGCSREHGKRPDGQTLVPWKRGKSIVRDFTCIDTFASSYTPSTSISAGAAALIAEERKKKFYDFLSDRSLLVPLALDTGGAWGKEGVKFIQEIGAKITETTGERKATSYLIQRLSICLQRGNAVSILGTLPAGKELFEIFHF